METGLTRTQVINLINLSPHGDYKQYLPVGGPAAKADPEFFAHLIAWAARKSEVRDANTALPVVAQMARAAHPDLLENAHAHMAALDPRNFLKAVTFSRGLDLNHTQVKRLVVHYLRERERSDEGLQRAILSHGKSLKTMYAQFRVKPNDRADKLLFKGERWGLTKALHDLRDQSPEEAAANILNNRLPFLNVMGVLGDKLKDEAIVHALINRMSPSELVNNSKMLLKLGMASSPALRGAYDEKLKAVASSGKNSLKTAKAAEAVGGATAEKLKAVQEQQLSALGIKGNWLVLGDKSASMKESIEASRKIASTLASLCEGKVTLLFFNGSPQKFDVTGKTLEQIEEQTKYVQAEGLTCCGIGLEYALANALEVDGIAIVTDGEETQHPVFGQSYQRLAAHLGKNVPAYVYLVKGGRENMLGNCQGLGVQLDVFDLRAGVDYYALPNLVKTMRSNRWSLADEIMNVPLLKLSQVLKPLKEIEHA